MSEKKSWFLSHLYLLGFLGFMGFFCFFNQPSAVLFFTFFGFFGWKWSMKYNDSEKDELFIANTNKATRITSSLFAGIVFTCMILLETYLFQWLTVEQKYTILETSISLGAALYMIVSSYLLDKYEKASRNVG